MKYKNLLVVDTQYSLLIYLLLVGFKDTYFLFGDNLDYRFGHKIKNLRKIKFLPIKIRNILAEIYEVIVIKIILYKINPKNIYGQDHIRLGNKISKMRKMKLIEDGSLNYLKYNFKLTILKKILEKIFQKNFKVMGFSDNIEKIYLTGLGKIPKEIEEKVEIINLKELWSKKNKDEKNKISEIFLGENFKDIIKKLKGKEIILFTQPLTEIEENEKIEIYRRIIDKYPKDKLIIKTHPREITDYKKYFDDIEVIFEKFPSEFFNFYSIKIKKTVTLFSTAALSFSKDVEVDFYGTNVHPTLLNHFGNCDKVMKRNKFI